ncbi:Lon protease family protein [Herminiimonas sp. CN]|uniref:Lon protease family protein n=1 Tax=Herminiimonas sp. CN TaxID=1349818 RepID=UPI000473D72E|nr:ATP-binding protein [Herminiimonas sp. CN]
MATIPPLPPDKLYRHCEVTSLQFDTTEQLVDLAGAVGQERALEAVKFGLEMQHPGFNLFVLGQQGTGKHDMLRRFLDLRAHAEAAPENWCYVNNFSDPGKPIALKLPHGRGLQLRTDMAQLVEELQSTIPAILESEDYRKRVDQIDTEFDALQKNSINALADECEAQDIALSQTDTGFSLDPARNGEIISDEEYDHLSSEQRDAIQNKIEALEVKLTKLLKQMAEWQKAHHKRLRELNREVNIFAVGHLFDDLLPKYADLPRVQTYLEAVKQDVIENAQIFQKPEEGTASQQGEALPPLRRYQVNLLVSAEEAAGAPVINENNPTYQNIIGRVEHLASYGALTTDFALIRPGALHKANGGYLLLDIHKVLAQPFAWEGLKQALTTGEIRIESLGQIYGIISTVSLEPQPIPLKVKVILFGEREYYYLLQAYDPDFAKLFKVAADFEDDVARDHNSQLDYARLIAAMVQEQKLLPFERAAVARIIEFSARDAGDAERLSLNLLRLSDLLSEAEYWAKSSLPSLPDAAGTAAGTVSCAHVQQAIDARIGRADRIQRRLQEEILRGTILIDSDGSRIGQINALSVMEIGDYYFAQPTRITATARLGSGEVIDIQREVAQGGAIHSKGVLILTSFLATRYCARQPLSLQASLVFEQTYGSIDGDSASLAELCALLSALADTPLQQSLAVTGSINQNGQVQAIGAVNEKIEGFFDICAARGLSGRQGVLIPGSNAKHLMLRADVVAACRDGRFAIYAVDSVDQAIEVLSGQPAGNADAIGNFPPDSINFRVRRKLTELFQIRASTTLVPTGRPQRKSRQKEDDDEEEE